MIGFRRAVLTLGVLMSFLLIPGCDLFGEKDELARAPASLRINLTDAPSAELASAEVSISRVYIDAPDGTIAQPGGSRNGAALELLPESESPAVFDLLELRDNIEALLVEAVVPPGRYEELHLVVDSATITLAEGLKFSDGTEKRTVENQSREGHDIRVRLEEPIDVESGVMTLLVVDFPADKSFVFSASEQSSSVEEVQFRPSLEEKRRRGIPLTEEAL